MEVPPPQLRLPPSSELGGASELEGTPEPGGLDDVDSPQPAPLPLVGGKDPSSASCGISSAE